MKNSNVIGVISYDYDEFLMVTNIAFRICNDKQNRTIIRAVDLNNKHYTADFVVKDGDFYLDSHTFKHGKRFYEMLYISERNRRTLMKQYCQKCEMPRDVALPDKMLLALEKAAAVKDVPLRELVNMIFDEWLTQQPQIVQGVYTYSEDLLVGLSKSERNKVLFNVAFGDCTFNEYGEPCFNPAEDDLDDSAYEGLATPEEIAESIAQMEDRRRAIDTKSTGADQ